MRGWLTPDSVPDEPTCYRVYIPDSDLSRRAFYGAIMLLGEAYNWEQFGTLTPDEISEAWREANLKTISDLRRCMPVGVIFAWPAETVPDGALLCDGSSYPTADYTELFNLIGYTFGGSGTSFNVPNLIDRFVYGTNTGIGGSGGEEAHTLTENEMPSHRHYSNSISTGIITIGAGAPTNVYIYNLLNDKPTTYVGSGAPHNNIPPYVRLRQCIQAK